MSAFFKSFCVLVGSLLMVIGGWSLYVSWPARRHFEELDWQLMAVLVFSFLLGIALYVAGIVG